jgi:uncharacterized protein (TIGR03435 family)
MHELDDSVLLREYVEQSSDAAFATLVTRHINKVYSVALRHTRNPGSAEEITQAVFVILARKSRHLGKRVILSGWLYQTARLTAVTHIRAEIRRVRREQEAYMQTSLNETDPDVWPQIAPLLDAAMAGLSETERQAIVLRFFDGKSMKEVGAALGASEDAVKMRVNRAVEKLRRFFSRRGIVVPAAALTAVISAHSVQAAPVTLVRVVTATAVAKGAAATTSTLLKGALKIMAWTKAKTAIVAGAWVLLAVGTTTVVMDKMRPVSSNIEPSVLDAYLQDPDLSIPSNAPAMVAIQPTHFPKQGAILGQTSGEKEIGRDIYLYVAILKAYGFPSFRRLICPEKLARTRVDYLVTVTNRTREKFQAEIKREFGLTAHLETRKANVLLLTVEHAGAPGLTAADNSSWEEWHARHPQSTGIHYHNITVATFADLIERLVPQPVVDGTGLAGKYDFVTDSFGSTELQQVFLDQLGFKLVPTNMPVEMLVVERAK